LEVVVSTVVTAFWCTGAFVAVFLISVWPKKVALASLLFGIGLFVLYGCGIIAEEFLSESMQIMWRTMGRFEGGNILYVIGAGLTGSFMAGKYKIKPTRT